MAELRVDKNNASKPDGGEKRAMSEETSISNVSFNGNEEYKAWIADISMRYKSSQIKAAMKINDEMLRFFWWLGHDIHHLKEKYAWGSHFYEKISKDLTKIIPNVKSFSPRNLLFMHQFYRMFPTAIITNQAGSQLKTNQISEEEHIFFIPWGHIRMIMGKCRDEHDKALFFVKKTFENNWSRAVLQNFLDTDLYERQGKAVTNFAKTLTPVQGDLAQAITKDPYNFDFISIREKYNEKELKDALMDSIKDFLLELGNGFAFVGREYRLMLGEKENFVDMLFFNIPLRCYVVLEVKITDFDASYAGKLGTYVVTVNHELKEDWMNPTIGLLVCKGLDKVEAQYALEASTQPIGVSGYELSKLIPEEYKGSMPTIEEIEAELENIEIKPND